MKNFSLKRRTKKSHKHLSDNKHPTPISHTSKKKGLKLPRLYSRTYTKNFMSKYLSSIKMFFKKLLSRLRIHAKK